AQARPPQARGRALRQASRGPARRERQRPRRAARGARGPTRAARRDAPEGGAADRRRRTRRGRRGRGSDRDSVHGRRRRGRGRVPARAPAEEAVVNRANRRATLSRGIVAALALSLAGAALLAALPALVGAAAAVRIVVAVLGVAYLSYVLADSAERTGRVTTIVAWTAAAAAAWLAEPPLGVYVVLHVGLIWLVRSLYRYSSVLSALADLALTALAAAFAAWAAQRAGSAWLALWCFFLVQAFHAWLPTTLRAGSAAMLRGAGGA